MPETPLPQPIPQKETPQGPIVRTYEDDLSRAMDTTEATVVQDLLRTAREREQDELDRARIRTQKKWYTTGGIILILLALGAGVYGWYYFRNLTVAVTPTPSVGIFQSTAPFIIENTPALQLVDMLRTDTTLPAYKPLLVPLTIGSGTPNPEQALDYLGIDFGEPFTAAFALVRLGTYRTDDTTSPFLILYAPTPEIASKELLIAEPRMLDSIGPLLGITSASQTSEVGTSFTSSYMYNLPVRTLRSRNLDTDIETILMYYGYATDQTIVIASDPQVLKAVYDTIIRQR